MKHDAYLSAGIAIKIKEPLFFSSNNDSMERGPQEIRDFEIPNSLNYIQESPLKLPLAPILSARGNPAVSARRGGSIFSPAQTLDPPENHPHHHRQLSPPPPQQREPTTPDSPLPPPPAAVAADANASVRYRECLKNHAASMGGHVVDGCGEFMPGGDEGTPESLRCAACDCHRSFHRKEVDGEPPSYPHHYALQRTPQPFLHGGHAAYSLPPPPQAQQHQHLRHHHHSHAPPTTMFNFGGGGGGAAESSSEDLNMSMLQASRSRKRFRTKFSQDQKDRMLEFASKIGWRIQKQDEDEVQRFCSEVGVKRQVFKVWMHNNKQATRRRSSSQN